LPTRLVELSDQIQFHEVEALNYPLFEAPHYSLALAVKMAEIAQRERLDLLHVHYAIPHSISGYLAREMLRGRYQLPVVTTLHGTDITLVGRDRSYWTVTKFAISESDGVTAISPYLANATCEFFGLPNIRVIPNFVDVEYYKRSNGECVREKLAPNNEHLLVHVSNFRSVKRATDCVEVLARVRARADARLVMVGDGPDVAACSALAQRLGVESSVVFVGKQPRIVDYLACADVLLLPSESESFGLVALEAMSCEVPVVATRVGGLPSVVSDGESGFLHEVADFDGMSESVLKILGDSLLAASMGAAGRRIAEARFTTETVIPQYVDYYREVLEKYDPGHSESCVGRYVR
jgi:N-acetyl-alpha-D-glucosaminyl L-malate synthase BshA